MVEAEDVDGGAGVNGEEEDDGDERGTNGDYGLDSVIAEGGL